MVNFFVSVSVSISLSDKAIIIPLSRTTDVFSWAHTLDRFKVEPFFLFIPFFSSFFFCCTCLSVYLFESSFRSFRCRGIGSMIFSSMKINVFRLTTHTKSINPISMRYLYIDSCFVHTPKDCDAQSVRSEIEMYDGLSENLSHTRRKTRFN